MSKKTYNCYTFGKEDLSKNEIGITKKLIGEKIGYFYCLECLAEYLEVDIDFLNEKIKEYKEGGCGMF